MFEQSKSENKVLKAQIEDLRQNAQQLEAAIEDLNNKLMKATYIINKASEGEVSFDGEMDKSKDHVPDPGANKTDGFTAKSNGSKARTFKIDKSNKEVEEYLKSVSGKSSVVKISKFTQTPLDPLRMLIENKDRLPELGYSQETVKRAIDVLLRLVGYKGLDDLITEAALSVQNQHDARMGLRSNSKGKNTPGAINTQSGALPGQPAQGAKFNQLYPGNSAQKGTGQVGPARGSQGQGRNATKGYQTDDMSPNEDDGMDTPEVDIHDPSLYPKLPRKGNQSKSPQPHRQVEYSPPPQDYDSYATSKKIYNVKPQTKRFTENEKREEERRFKESLNQAGNPEDEYEVYLSKIKIEKELTLFRMYLNIKQRYFKDPSKFVKTFTHYFGREPPKIREGQPMESLDSDEFLFSFPEFKEYYANLMHIHDKCGEDCVHLQRWYKKMGIRTNPTEKKYVQMHQLVIDRLPKSIPRRETSLDKLVRKYYKYY